MNDIHAYSIWTYEKKISHDCYWQIVAHDVCDAHNWGFHVWRQKESSNNPHDMCMNYTNKKSMYMVKFFPQEWLKAIQNMFNVSKIGLNLKVIDMMLNLHVLN